jgi:hypothetical protein
MFNSYQKLPKALSLGANEYFRKSDYEGDDLVAKVQEVWNKVQAK